MMLATVMGDRLSMRSILSISGVHFEGANLMFGFHERMESRRSLVMRFESSES